MSIRAEIRRILLEALPSLGNPLTNPLDKAADAITLGTTDFKGKVDSLKQRSEKEKKDLSVNLNAKRKARMVPQSGDPSIDRQRRQYDGLQIKDLEDKLSNKNKEAEEIDALSTDIGNLTGSVSDLERERMKLQNMLSDMGEMPAA